MVIAIKGNMSWAQGMPVGNCRCVLIGKDQYTTDICKQIANAEECVKVGAVAGPEYIQICSGWLDLRQHKLMRQFADVRQSADGVIANGGS